MVYLQADKYNVFHILSVLLSRISDDFFVCQSLIILNGPINTIALAPRTAIMKKNLVRGIEIPEH